MLAEVMLLLIFFLSSIGIPRPAFALSAVGFILAETEFIRFAFGARMVWVDVAAFVTAAGFYVVAIIVLIYPYLRRRLWQTNA